MNIKLFTATTVITALAIAPLANADKPVKYSGVCDGSAAVPVDSSGFIVANDEDNILRVYKRDKSGELVYSQDISCFLQIDPKGENPEADIEGAALVGNRIYWISSHGTNDEGEPRPNRFRFFATDIESNGNHINLKSVGTPFLDLVQVLENSADLKKFDLGEAAKKSDQIQRRS